MTLTQKEQTRLQVLNGVLVDQVPIGQAAEVLGDICTGERQPLTPVEAA